MTHHDRPAANVFRFGVLGTGRITRRLVAALQSTKAVEVTAIASRSSERARWYADQYGIAAAVPGYRELVGRDDVDAVYVALPPSLHAEWSVAAADQGKHVLCEKPLATTAEAARSIDRACRAADVRWLDATAWLHHPRTAAITQHLRDRRLGRLTHVTASVSFFEPFQSGDHRLDANLGGGCLLDLGWYAAGLVRFAAGRPPVSVYADAVTRDSIPRRVSALAWFDDEMTAAISCGYDTATRKWCEIAGSDASIVCDDFTRPWAEKPARFWLHHASGEVDQEKFGGHQERGMIATLAGRQSLADYHRQALETQQILDALSRSIACGRRVELSSGEPSS